MMLLFVLGASLSFAAEAPLPLFQAPSCDQSSNPALPDFLEPAPTENATTCRVDVICRCGQRLSCTSPSGDCLRVIGCSVTCDGDEQVCPPCRGFACA